MLHLTTSNRYETLRARLLARLAEAPADPFQAQEVIIPSAAIKRDLQLATARIHGVAAGMDFPFLAQWLWERIAQLVPVEPVSPFAPERAAWRLYRLFQEPDLVAPHPRLAGYLEQADPLMALDLARRVATLFEQYITYRPDWLAAWSEGQPARLPGAGPRERQDEAWQMALWQRFTADLGTARQHPSAAFFAALERLGPAGVARAGLPAEAHIFCLSTLPPLYLKMLTRLADWTRIHLYLINPCRDYWTELVAAKRQARLEAQGKGDYLDDRYPLLADWGRQTQALFGLILETVAEVSDEDGDFQPHGGTSLLARFQDSLLDLDQPAPGQWPLDDQDRSIEIHAAHSLTRELEILQDQLQARFDADPSLGPADVLVALPDLDAAAPLIDAVFGTAARLPYTITGQKAVRANPAARVLLQLLDLAAPPARLPATQVLALLQEPLVAHRLGLDETDLEQLHQALEAAGVHWGLDAQGRAAAGLPADPRHTWRDALSRLLLGYALPDRDDQAYAHTAPAGHLGGSRAQPLGALWWVLERLESLGERLARPLPAAAWQALWEAELEAWLGDRPGTPEEAEALQQVRAGLAPLCQSMAEGDPATPIPLAAARAALESALEAQARGGMPAGSITFTALPSLRQLPYRLVCLLGLDDGAFPKPDKPLEFDLTPLEARPGDRQRRQDERNLFLDLILAARDGLYLSYTGRSQRDDSPLPPSILVAELLEFLCRASGAQPSRFLVRHPLQAFSPDYFASAKPDPRLVSYNAQYAAALAAQAAAPLPGAPTPDDEEDDQEAPPTSAQPSFFTRPLPPGEAPTGLAQLHAFFRHPGRHLLRDRLGIALPEGEVELADEEPLLLDGLTRYGLATRLLDAALAGAAAAQLTALAAAGPELPSGRLGETQVDAEVDAVRRFAAQLQPRLADLGADPLAVHLHLASGRSLAGQLPSWGPAGLLRYRCARAGAADYLGAWIDHLCLNALAPAGVALVTTHVARDKTFHFNPVPDAAARLDDLLDAWQAGQHQPLPFYPKTAWALVTAGEGQARQQWLGQPDRPGESADPWWALALRGQADVLGAAFADWAQRLLEPLLAHLDDPELPG